jgi:hypothetical protein
VTRWPGRRVPPPPVEPPAWWRHFEPADWAEPGDGEVRYPAGALMGAEVVARRRWTAERRRWAAANSFDVVRWLGEQHRARLGRRPARRARRAGPRAADGDVEAG